MDKKNNIGTQIKSRLKDLSASPDISVWENIEKELKKKKRKRILFFWWMSIGSLLIAALISTLLFNNVASKDSQQKITQEEKKPTIQNSNKKDNAVYDLENEEVLSTNKSDKKHNLKPSKTKNLLGFIKNKDKIPHKEVDENSNTRGFAKTLNQKSSSDSLNYKQEKSLATQNRKTKIKEEVNNEISGLDSSQDIKKLQELKEKRKDSTKNKDKSRWSVTPQGILSYYGAFKGTTTNNTSYNFGFLASYKMSSQFYARTGIRLLNLNQDTNGIRREVTYYQFPLEIKYAPFQNKINPYAIAGFSYYSLRESKTSNTNQNFQATAGLNAGLGAEIQLLKKTFINFESIFNYQLMPFSGQYETKPYILNLSLGIEYRF